MLLDKETCPQCDKLTAKSLARCEWCGAERSKPVKSVKDADENLGCVLCVVGLIAAILGFWLLKGDAMAIVGGGGVLLFLWSVYNLMMEPSGPYEPGTHYRCSRCGMDVPRSHIPAERGVRWQCPFCNAWFGG